MARKIGFGDDDPNKLSAADQVVQSFRRKARGNRVDRDAPDSVVAPKTDKKRTGRTFSILFLLVWLTAWTTAIIFVSLSLLSGEHDGGGFVFMSFWLAFAVFGEIAALRALMAAIRGKTR